MGPERAPGSQRQPVIPSPGCRIQSGSQMGLWDEDIFRLPQSETVPAVCRATQEEGVAKGGA